MAHGWKRQRCMAIMVFMVLMLAMTHCFKISNRLKVETGTNLKTKDHSSSTSKDSTSQDSSSSSTTEQTPPVEVPEGTTFTIKRSSSTNADDESNEIVVGNKDFENLMKDSYKQMRDKFSFSQATVTTQDHTKSTTANSEDFNSFLSLSSNYNNINSLFSISSSLNVNSLFCYYFVDNKWANKVVDLCFSEASSSTGFYKVEASKLIP